MSTIRPVRFLCALWCGGLWCAGASAQSGVESATPAAPVVDDAQWEPGLWKLQFEPAVWWAAMGGDVRVGSGGATTKFKDFAGDADDPHAAFSLRGLYRRDRWTVMVDGFAYSFDEGDAASAEGSLDFSLWSVDASVGYTVWERTRRRTVRGVETDSGAAVRLIPYVGLRAIRPDLTLDASGGRESGSDLFVHPIVGARIEIEVADRLSFDTGFDAGGFDILGEDAASLDWTVGIRYHPTPKIAVQIGFRQMFINVDSDDLEIDGSLGGLMAGVMIRF